MRRRFCNIPVLFVICAVVLNGIYLSVFSPLWSGYDWGGQRFFHVLELAEGWRLHHNHTHIPVSFLELEAAIAPGQVPWISKIPCEDWEDDVSEIYCDLNDDEFKYVNPRDIALNPEYAFHYVSQPAMAHYPWVSYLPYTLGAWVGLVLKMRPYWVLYSAVLSNFICVTALGYCSLRLLPVLRWPAFFLLLMPSMCMTRIFIMPDGLNLDICLLLVAMVLRLKQAPVLLTWPQKTLQALTALAIGLVKIAYLPMAAMLALVPAHCYGGIYKKASIVGTIWALAAGLSIAWMMAVSQNAYQGNDDTLTNENLKDKIYTVAEHPLQYLNIALSGQYNIMKSLNDFLCWVRVGWNADSVGLLLVLIAPLFLSSLVAFPAQNILRLTRADRLFCVALLAATIGYMLVLSDISDSDIDMTVQNGILDFTPSYLKGRYLIPLMPLLLVAIHGLVPCLKWQNPCRNLLGALVLASIFYLHYMQIITHIKPPGDAG